MAKTATKIKEEVERYIGLPYMRELIKNEDGSWFARIAEFTGCMTEGVTVDEAMNNLDDAMAAWIEVKIEDGEAIPPPLNSGQYSGKFLMRVPKTLHRELVRRADLEGVSLNQYALTALAQAVGMNC